MIGDYPDYRQMGNYDRLEDFNDYFDVIFK